MEASRLRAHFRRRNQPFFFFEPLSSPPATATTTKSPSLISNHLIERNNNESIRPEGGQLHRQREFPPRSGTGGGGGGGGGGGRGALRRPRVRYTRRLLVLHSLTFPPPPPLRSSLQELFIKGLAESKAFQRFAVHTDRHLQNVKKDGFEHVNAQIDELHKHATRAAYSTSAGTGTGAGATTSGGALRPPRRPSEGVAGFFSALGRVIRRDLGMNK
ncbi:hypothetical protein ACHAWF_013952 [Thalassiosira exigua]